MLLRSVPTLFVLVFLTFGCRPNDPEAPSEETVRALLAEHATQSRVERALGKEYIFYEKNTPGWSGLDSATDVVERVREGARKYPKAMYYTTMWQQTWIFLDDDNVMQHYVITSQ